MRKKEKQVTFFLFSLPAVLCYGIFFYFTTDSGILLQLYRLEWYRKGISVYRYGKLYEDIKGQKILFVYSVYS